MHCIHASFPFPAISDGSVSIVRRFNSPKIQLKLKLALTLTLILTDTGDRTIEHSNLRTIEQCTYQTASYPVAVCYRLADLRARSKLQGWKMQEWKIRHGNAGGGGKCMSGIFAGGYVFERPQYLCVYNVELKSDRVCFDAAIYNHLHARRPV